MKPKALPHSTGIFFELAAELHGMPVASTSAEVCLPRTTSSSFMTLAGLKKCRPSRSCGRETTAAMASMSR